MEEESTWNREYKTVTGVSAEAEKSRTLAGSIKLPQPHGDLQKAILNIVTRKALSPAEITLELAKKTTMTVSQKGVGVAIHELHKNGLLEMVGPSMYKKVRN